SFFFSSRRRHTRFSRDWSSDVCSSDLPQPPAESLADERGTPFAGHEELDLGLRFVQNSPCGGEVAAGLTVERHLLLEIHVVAVEIGRASCRERVWASGASVTGTHRGVE